MCVCVCWCVFLVCVFVFHWYQLNVHWNPDIMNCRHDELAGIMN